MPAGTVPPGRPGSGSVVVLVVRQTSRDRRREDRGAVRCERDGRDHSGSVESAEGEVVSVEACHCGDEGLEVEDREPPLGGQTVLGRERLRGRSSALLEESDAVVGREESDEFEGPVRAGCRGRGEQRREFSGADGLDPGGTVGDRSGQERAVRRPEQDREDLVAEVDLPDQHRVVPELVEGRHEGIVAGRPRSSAPAECAGDRGGRGVVPEHVRVVRHGVQDLVGSGGTSRRLGRVRRSSGTLVPEVVTSCLHEDAGSSRSVSAVAVPTTGHRDLRRPRPRRG